MKFLATGIWPPPATPEEFEANRKEALARETEWMIKEVRKTMKDLKHGLEDCYALLAPIDPGSTLVLSTHRNERVKGHITRIGTRIVKGTIHLQLRSLPPQTLSINPKHPIHVPPLESLNTHLTESINLLSMSLAHDSTPRSLSDHLRALAASIKASTALLQGPPLTEADPAWQDSSWPPVHFSPPLGPGISLFLGLQEAALVLWLRSLEPVAAPVHFGTKLGLALGTVRRLEHDEMDKEYTFRYSRSTDGGAKHVHKEDGVVRKPTGLQDSEERAAAAQAEDVFVREKVRVETADPSLISLATKLGALSNTLTLARINLAAAMEEDLDDHDGSEE